jgi:Rad3-related DNA helicase
MTEGVDLVDDASRFQIICKIPYPYLGDKLVVKRMNRWKWWYPLQTAKTIVQSIGRSVRNSTDYAVTYILDSDWNTFYGKNKKYFPDDFEKCIK